MKIDLHMHSSCSDGTLSPAELVKKAKESGLEVIALTDHDTTAGIEEALREAKKLKIELIPGIEISTYLGSAEYHILGYFIDIEDKGLKKLSDDIIKSRIERTKKIVNKLREMGYKLNYSDVKKYASGISMGRPHIARALVEKGYAEEISEAFTDDLIGGGSPAYVEKKKITPKTAIKTILKAGGIPVIAHPFLINHGSPLEKEDIKEMKKDGLKGIEVYQSKHDKKTSMKYKKIAEELDLLITGGSDYHGENSPGILPGDWGISKNEYQEFIKAKNTK